MGIRGRVLFAFALGSGFLAWLFHVDSDPPVLSILLQEWYSEDWVMPPVVCDTDLVGI